MSLVLSYWQNGPFCIDNDLIVLSTFVFNYQLLAIFFPKTQSISKIWSTPSPSHSPADPPRNARKSVIVNFTKSVLITVTVSSNVISIVDSLEEEASVVIFDDINVVDLQGKRQSDKSVPSAKSEKRRLVTTIEVVTRVMLSAAHTGVKFSGYNF